MIEINNVTKIYGSHRAVDDITFTVNNGEILGFLGPNGAGKSTTMKMITGYMPPTSGSIKIDGYDIFEEPMMAKRRIGYLPEMPPLYNDMTVNSYLDFVSDLKGVKATEKKDMLDHVINEIGLKEVRKRLIKNLSKGYKQRVGLAQAIIGEPDVLILDEPTVGLDPKQIKEIRDIIKKLGEKHTIILSTHILPEVSMICNRVVIIDKGKIVAIDDTENLSNGLQNERRYEVQIAGPSNKIKELIKELYGVKKVIIKGKDDDIVTAEIITTVERDIRKEMFFSLAKAGYPIIELKSIGFSLEEVFLQLTTKEEAK